MQFTYTDKELSHADILSKVAAPCHSNKSGFTETTKLDNIRELLKDSGYHEILLPNAQIWRKDDTTPIDVLVSSHADFVKEITKPYSKLGDDGYYDGTYDNAGPAGASVIAMLEGDIPANVVFAFTADEETGRCNGAGQALEYVTCLGYENPLCIALDVTYEGYDDGLLYTIENLSSGHKKNEDMNFINSVGSTIMSLEKTSEDENITYPPTCSLVRLHKDATPENLSKEFIAKECGWYDEAQFYVHQHMRSFSICLPSNGEMHANSGLDVRQPEFEGYLNALESVIYTYSLEPSLAQERIAPKAEENASLMRKDLTLVKEEEEQEAKEREEEAARAEAYMKAHPNYKTYPGGPSNGDFCYYNDEDDEDYGYGHSDSYAYSMESEDIAEIPYLEPNEYGESDFKAGGYTSFDDYVNDTTETLPEDIMDYYPPDQCAAFIGDTEPMIPKDIMEYLGGPEATRHFLIEMFNFTYGLENDESENLESKMKALDDTMDDAISIEDEYDSEINDKDPDEQEPDDYDDIDD